MNAGHSRRKEQRKSQVRTNNVRVLRPRKRPRLSVGRIVMLALSIYFIIWAIYPITYRLEQQRELDGYKRQLESIKEQNAKLKEETEYLKSDEYVEQEARELGLTKPDEEMVVVITPDSNKSLKGKADKVEKDDVKTQPVSLWQRIVGAFSSVF